MEYEYKCKWCGRFLNVIVTEAIDSIIICPDSRCRGGTHVKAVNNNPYTLLKEVQPKKKLETPKAV